MTQRNRFIQIVTAGYMGGSLVWIFLSDQLLGAFTDLGSVVWLSTAKGIFFVVATSALLFFALRAVPSAKLRNGEPLQEVLVPGQWTEARSRWLRYAFSLVITLSMVSVHDQITGPARDHTMLILLIFPIILSAMCGGLGPGLVSTALAAIGVGHLVFEPAGEAGLAPGHQLFNWGVLIGNGIVISLLSARLKRSLATSEINRRLLDAVVSGTSDAVFVKDARGRYLLVNEAAARFVGKRPEEIVGQDDRSHFDASIAQQIMAVDQAILSQGGVRTLEERISPINGGEAIFLVTNGPVFDQDGKTVGVFGISRDITERKRSEESLRHSEQRFRRLFHQSPVAMGIVDPDGRVLDTNLQFVRLFGYDLSDISTLDAWWQRAFPDAHYRQRAIESWHELVGTAADACVAAPASEWTITCKDGSERTVVVSGISTGDALLATFFDISRRKQAESQRDLLSEALRQSSHPLLLADDATHVTYVNPAFSRLFGYTPDELVGLPIGRLVPHTEDELKLHADVIRTARREGAWSGELERLSSAGMRIPVVSNVGAIHDERRRLVGFVVSYLDLRPLRERDALLRKLSLAVEQSPESILITNLRAEIEYVNEAFLNNTGYSREEVIGQRPNILRSGNTPKETFESLWEALHSGLPWKGEICNRRRDGSEYIDFAIVAPIRQPDGTISHYVSVQQDITAQKRTAEELTRYRDHLEELVAERTQEVRVQTQSLRALIDNIPHLAWLKDRDSRYIAVNRAVADVHGERGSALVGKTDFDVWPADFAAQYRADDLEVMASRRQKTAEGPLATAPDTLYETFKAPIIDSDGSVLGTVGFSRDILPQRRMEAELARRAEEAEAATRAKSAFLANMSHEIRTPMNAIMGMAELCDETDLNERQRSCLAKIKSASDSLLRIIDDILDFSKIEAGRLSMECVPFMLGDVFDKLSAVTALRAEQLGIELGYAVCDDTMLLGGDPLRLGQVLTNLVANALKFSNGGEVIVSVECADAGDDWIELHFSVRDRGIGMSPEQLAGLFRPFHQADISTTRRFGGTGLGLAISHHLVERMSGRIWVDSAPGEGSTFHFTARFGQLGLDRRALTTALARHLEDHDARTILIVERSPVTRQLLAGVVAQLGLDACCAASADAALEALAARGTQAFLGCLLGRMPSELDTCEAASLLRRALKSVPARTMPMLLVTDLSHQDVPTTLVGSVDGVLTKPVSAHHLRDELARSLGLAVPVQPGPERRRQGPDWSRFNGLDVLLVEDTQINQEVMSELLKRAGLCVRIAANGAEALEAVSLRLPDLILMDCQMPVMDGYAAARKLRDNPAWMQTPIIALTANAMAEDEEACRAAGMDAHVAKPLRMDVLYERIVQCLPAWRAASTAAPTEPRRGSGDRLPALPGIAFASGAGHVGCASSLLHLLKHFRDGLGSRFAQDYQAACAAGDHASAVRLAHSLKGVAHTLGAHALGDAAAALEAELTRQTALAHTERLSPVLAELRTVVEGLASIENLIDAARPIEPRLEASSPATLRQRAMIEQLSAMLERFDTEAVSFVREVVPFVSTSPQRDAWNEVRWHIERYDFDAAVQSLEALQQALAAGAEGCCGQDHDQR